MTLNDREEKERLAESHFQNWLDKNDIPYWYIQQDLKTFSPALNKYMTKRPDFLILVPNVGFILVDVKYKRPATKYEVFQVDAEETQKYSNLQIYFNLQVWYAFSNPDDHFNVWHWIPASVVLETGKKYKSRKSGGDYFTVPMDKFIVLPKSDNLGRLFSEIPKFL